MTDKFMANKLGGIFAQPQKLDKSKPPSQLDDELPSLVRDKLRDEAQTSSWPNLVDRPMDAAISDFDQFQMPVVGAKRNMPEKSLIEILDDSNIDNQKPADFSFSFGMQQETGTHSPGPHHFESQRLFQVTASEVANPHQVESQPEFVQPTLPEKEQVGQRSAEQRLHEPQVDPIGELIAYAACYHPNTAIIAVNDPRVKDDSYLDAFLQDCKSPSPPKQSPGLRQLSPVEVADERLTWSPVANPLASVADSYLLADKRKTKTAGHLQQRHITETAVPVATVRTTYKRRVGVASVAMDQALAVAVLRCLPDITIDCGDANSLQVDIAGVCDDAPLAARLSDLLPPSCRFAEITITDSRPLIVSPLATPPAQTSAAEQVIASFVSTAGSYALRPSVKRLAASYERSGSISNFTAANSHASVTVLSSVDPRTVDLQRDIKLRRLDVDYPRGWRCVVKLFGVGAKTGRRLVDHLLLRRDVASATYSGGCVIFATDN